MAIDITTLKAGKYQYGHVDVSNSYIDVLVFQQDNEWLVRFQADTVPYRVKDLPADADLILFLADDDTQSEDKKSNTIVDLNNVVRLNIELNFNDLSDDYSDVYLILPDDMKRDDFMTKLNASKSPNVPIEETIKELGAKLLGIPSENCFYSTDNDNFKTENEHFVKNN